MSKLRVGVMLDPGPVPSWMRAALERVVRSDHSEIALIVFNDMSSRGTGMLRRIWRSRRTFLYGLFARFDAWMSRVEPDPFAPMSIEDLIVGVPRISVCPTRTRFSDRIVGKDLERIRSADLDVLVRAGFRILRGDVLHAARYGVWSYHHGDGIEYRGSPAGIWELIDGCAVTGTVLQVLTEDLDAGGVITRSYGATDMARLRRGLARTYWKSSVFLERELARLQRHGASAFRERLLANTPVRRSARLRRAPTNVEMIRFLPGHLMRLVTRRARRLQRGERWILLYAFDVGPVPTGALRQLRRILPPSGRFWADPFIGVDGDEHVVFFEDGPSGGARARISCLRVDRSGVRGASSTALERPYHLSYPFVFSDGGTYFMLPETSENNAIELYRCTRFPDRWELAATVVAGIYGVDPTIVRADDRWWLFVNVREHPAASALDELYLFSTTDLLSGPWVPHPANPIVSDVRRARPAGRPFWRDGILYRPAQDGAERYGHAIVINQVIALTTERYEERPVDRIGPGWDRAIVAIHTLDHLRGLTVLDGALEQAVFRTMGR